MRAGSVRSCTMLVALLAFSLLLPVVSAGEVRAASLGVKGSPPPPDLSPRRQLRKAPADITNGTAYGDILEIGNTVRPTGVVVMLHGLGDNCYGLAQAAESLAGQLPHLLILLPSSSVMPLAFLHGVERPSWFGITTRVGARLSTGVQDSESLHHSIAYLMKLTARVMDQYGVPRDRLCVGGFSQGGAVALAMALLSAVRPPAGVYVVAGFLPDAETVLAEHAALVDENPAFGARFHSPGPVTRVALFHGKQDHVIHFPVALEGRELLERRVFRRAGAVELNVYPNAHTLTADGAKDVATFIAAVLPELSTTAASVTAGDADL